MVIQRVEMAVNWIKGSTGHGTSSEFRNPDRRDLFGNIRRTLFMSASSRLDLDNELNRNDETRDNEDFQDGDHPALRPKFDRKTHAHHRVNVQNAPHSSVPEYLTVRIYTQNNPLPQQFTQPQTVTTHSSPDNTLPRVEQTPHV